MLLVNSNSLEIVLNCLFVLFPIPVCLTNIAESWSYIYTIFSFYSLHNLNKSLKVL